MKPSEFDALIEKMAGKRGARVALPAVSVKPQRESVLHRQIKQECNRRGLLACHGAMHRRTGRTLGEPDFVILLPDGKVLLVEAKAHGGKLSDDQERFHGKAWALGHHVRVVLSFEEFLMELKGVLE